MRVMLTNYYTTATQPTQPKTAQGERRGVVAGVPLQPQPEAARYSPHSNSGLASKKKRVKKEREPRLFSHSGSQFSASVYYNIHCVVGPAEAVTKRVLNQLGTAQRRRGAHAAAAASKQRTGRIHEQ